MALAVLAVFVVTPAEVWAGQEFVRVLSSSQTVSAANPAPTPPAANVGPDNQPIAKLKAARNEFESFQVYVKADAAGIANLRVDPGKPLVQVDPATGNDIVGGASIPAENLTFYREHFLNITTRSDNEGATGEWADALIPEKDYIYGEDRNAFPYTLGENQRAVAWVDVLVPEDQPAGTYKGTVLVKNDAESAPAAPGVNRGVILKTIDVTVEVKDFTIPSESTLDSAFMMSQNRSAGWKSDPCTGYPAAVCDTEDERWKLYAQYARMGLENRVTIPNPFATGDPGNAPSAAQQPFFEKYSLPLIDGLSSGAGIGTPGYSRLNGARLTAVGAAEYCLSNDDPVNQGRFVYSDVCLKRWQQLATTPGHRFDERFFLYTDDEMNTVDEWNEFKHRAGLARTAWTTQPEISTLVTGPMNNAVHPDTGEVLVQGARSNGAVPKLDILVALVNYMDNTECGNGAKVYVGNQRAAYEALFDPALETAGTSANRLWMYTSDMSFSSDTCLQDGWPGYAIDQPDTQARAMGWMSYYYGASGELYWQTTQMQDTAWTDQLTDNFNGGENAKGNGDGNLFYPGTTARIGGDPGTDIPVESIRLKRIRDGREDYEYMHLLKQQGKEAQAINVIGSAFPNGYGDKNYQTACPAGTVRPTSPNGGCGASAMYTTISASAMDAARLQLMNLVNPEEPGNTCQGAAVTVAGATDGSETIEGTTGTDVINGLGGNDTINGLGGNDKLCGGNDFDTLSGGLGDDFLEGEALEYGRSATGVSVDLAALRATGEGTDTLLGADFSEVYGSPQADTITGNDKNNYLAGIDGNDDLVGSGGDDILRGDAGDDSINSREGASDKGLWAPPLTPYTERYGVLCGAGTDSVVADAQELDTANADCETVHRPDPIDTTPPTGEVKINNGAASTRNRAVVLNLSATDPDPGSGVAQMRFSHNAETWTAWQTYAAKKKWTLKKGKSGKRVVYAQFVDGAANPNPSEVFRDTIRYRR